MTGDNNFGSVVVTSGVDTEGATARSHAQSTDDDLGVEYFTFGDLKGLGYHTELVEVVAGTYSGEVCV